MNFKALKSKSGQQGGLIAGVLLVVVGGVFLMIGLFLKSEVAGAIDRDGFSAAENTTFDDVTGNIDTAFTLLGVSMIVAGAAVILNFLRGAF